MPQFPAGLIDAGETAAQAALRELREETGYSGTVVEVSPARLPPGCACVDCYCKYHALASLHFVQSARSAQSAERLARSHTQPSLHASQARASPAVHAAPSPHLHSTSAGSAACRVHLAGVLLRARLCQRPTCSVRWWQVCYSDPGMSNANMQFAVVRVDAAAPENAAISPALEARPRGHACACAAAGQRCMRSLLRDLRQALHGASRADAGSCAPAERNAGSSAVLVAEPDEGMRRAAGGRVHRGPS